MYVGRNFRADYIQPSTITCGMQAVYSRRDAPAAVTTIVAMRPRELVTVSSTHFLLPIRCVLIRLDIRVDYFFNNDEDTDIANFEDRPYLRYCVDLDTEDEVPTVTCLRHTKPIRAELEIGELGRTNIEDATTSTGLEVRTLPFTLFINDFSVHRNMYRAIKAFY